MPPIILNDRGQPEPSPFIMGCLKRVHAGLSLRHTPHTGPQWAILLQWQPDDRRWQYVQSGEMPPDSTFDIIGYLPMDCPLDDAPAYVAKVFRQSSRAEVQRMADAVLAHNASAPVATMVDEAIAEVLDQVDPSAALPKRRGRPRKGA
jgi:hypothetical protein